MGSRSSSSGSSGRVFSWGGFGPRTSPWRYGFWSGCYVPVYGYGYGYYAPAAADYDPYGPARAAPNEVQPEPSQVRSTFGIEGMGYLNGQ